VNRFGELHGIALTRHVHVDDRNRSSKQVIVDGSDLHATRQQALHRRADLGFGKDQIAHEHRASVVRHECNPGAEGERGTDECHSEI